MCRAFRRCQDLEGNKPVGRTVVLFVVKDGFTVQKLTILASIRTFRMRYMKVVIIYFSNIQFILEN